MRRALATGLITVVIAALTVVATATPSGAVPPDPGGSGPLAVTMQDYDFGDSAFSAPGFPGPIEVRARVWRPTTLSGGPYPLVLFLHGRHATCFSGGSAFLQWPCSGGSAPIPSHQGYAYIASVLASHGYIVASVSANGINAADNSVFDLGADARARLLQHHLDRWNTWNTTGGTPFGTTFVGNVDMDNIGTMGHSRGGEGVVAHHVFNQSLGSPYTIRSVIPLAPVDFNRPVINNVALDVILPWCDGDVSDLQGAHFFDDALYNVPGDSSAKFWTTVMGANHNFFNTVWTPGMFSAGTSDDWGFVGGGSSDPACGPSDPDRLTSAEQRAVGLAYIAGFLRYTLGGENDLEPIFTEAAPAPASIGTAEIFQGYHAPDDPALRLDINRLVNATDLTTNDVGGAVTQTGLSPYDMCGGLSPQPLHCLSGDTDRQPHTTPSARSSKRGLPQLRMGWSAVTATLTNSLGAGGLDVSAYDWLQLRATVNFSDVRNPAGSPRDFRVVLTDGSGGTASVEVDSQTDALRYPPGAIGPVPKVLLNMVRLPTSAFAGVDLTDLASISFRFDQVTTGALLVANLAFSNDPNGAAPPAATCNGLPATIVGSSGPDALNGTPGADVIAGLAGDDTIHGGGGADTICGNEGDDALLGEAGNDTLFGNEDDDVIEGGTADDTVSGGSGADTGSFASSATAVNADLATNVATGEGNDTFSSIENLRGSGLADTLNGNGQANVLDGSGAGDVISGSSGNDTLQGGGGPDDLRGGPGDDDLFGGAAGDTLRGDDGNDDLDGGTETDTASFTTALAGVTVNLGAGTATGQGADTITAVEDIIGSQQADGLTGNGGPNKIQGRAGADFVDGGAGDDDLRGNGGDDVIEGGTNDDILNGGSGADTLDGEDGNDTVAGQSGAPDACVGGPGVDIDGGGCESIASIP